MNIQKINSNITIKMVADIGTVYFKKSLKAKRLRISIKNNGKISVTIPAKFSLKTAEDFIHSKKQWIQKHLQRIDERNKFTLQNSENISTDKKYPKLILHNRLNEISLKYDLQYNRLFIRSQKTRWGSCSAKNNISLNIKLINLPAELIDYVILHELVHTKVKNHQKEFWSELEKYIKEPKLIDAKLKRYNLALL
ncbi:MAG: M48 family metallopeptidase [Candidatus Cloacimonetes bacterium]|nr:M48 family metallopeptidase [Candidatus Cloacimonadota bacterium]